MSINPSFSGDLTESMQRAFEMMPLRRRSCATNFLAEPEPAFGDLI